MSAPVAPKVPVEVPLAWPAGGADRIEFVSSIDSRSDVLKKKGILSRMLDLAAGSPDRRRTSFLRPCSTAIDPEGRLIVTDPEAGAAHILDLEHASHKFLEGPSRLRMRCPIGAAVDAGGKIYISDADRGVLYLFDRDGSFQRLIGEKKGEGFFKRPTGLAVDRATGRIYLTDTLAHKVYVLNPGGGIEREWGRRGTANGDFNFPLAVAVADQKVFVLDSLNFRVQVFSPSGDFLWAFGHAANEPGGLFRPKGLAVDSNVKRVYVVDAMFGNVQAFSYEGRLIWAFGRDGRGPGEFSLPSGISVQSGGDILVADSWNQRIQIFRHTSTGAPAGRERR